MSHSVRRGSANGRKHAPSAAKWARERVLPARPRRHFTRLVKNSLVGSTINTFGAIVLLLSLFAGLWVHEKFEVPASILILAGVGCVFLVGWLQEQTWRAYSRRWRRGRTPSKPNVC